MGTRRRKVLEPAEPPTLGVVREVREWADALLKSGRLVGATVRTISELAVPVTRAGHALKDVREAAGLSVRELAAAVGLGDPKLLRSMEAGKAAIPFELILRFAAVLGRNDPLPFILRLTRASNPQLAAALEALGVGRLIVHAEREREFLNLYRGADELRTLSDAEFKAFLGFMRSSVELALEYRRRGR